MEGIVIKTVTQNVKTESNVDNNKVSVLKQKNAFPPNFVHSLDATHMMMTALKCKEANISFAGVHDSFWTHAGDVSQCRDILRNAFYELYKKPPAGELHLLEKLLAEVKRDNPNLAKMMTSIHDESSSSIDFVPMPGNLDLEGVKTSTYFFN